ncbi:uncharacterized protein MYCFIDRAFT_211454 [Pseudocercospora fijiensis CIRAD86]|uniref:Uncharacterized protein n=1 Tax=Pseudocercospora fijiensis (strain CIRAD86) TaxID=383855 RepID=M3AB42_PSEFD|nr:uncharacterized protein MYCFIDRAFT_211454 [Pseudocercospora fijiensis CIRAD86]EME81786.1 hypothetical protein MYCFIDRAFT_211454 [Pseudocercospora fijiensis CIRAD86]
MHKNYAAWLLIALSSGAFGAAIGLAPIIARVDKRAEAVEDYIIPIDKRHGAEAIEKRHGAEAVEDYIIPIDKRHGAEAVDDYIIPID